ncbi:threonine ammonia-lyase, biosynthetic [Metapseudomonas furukawaii]|uniref:threonine ammonia-lyase, biosynthetic n=1 Tax=Metapseudomonas furukawaii TaxID=1149133 RepID=UPI00404684A3
MSRFTPATEPLTPTSPDAGERLLKHYVRKILAAPVYDVAIETPLQPARQLSERLGNQVLLKREDLQPVFSFKIRGAYNRVVQLSAEERSRGVIAASAGNHAQGLALAARELGVKATIVMPRTTPELKVQGVRSRGGKVVLHGDAFPDALAHALKLAEEQGLTFVPPYDDPDVIAGQGTVAMEILRQHAGPLDAIFVPVGGGSLIAGIAAYVKYLRPEIRVIGVEPEDSNCLQAALAAGERVVLSQVGLFADGVAVAQIGAHNFELCRHFVDEVLTVSADEICAAIKDIYDDTRSITEPAGALAVAGIKKYVERDGVCGQTLVAIDSGANINFDRLRHVAERAELGEQREAILAVTLPERPGAFRAFCEALGRRQITEFNYRYSSGDAAHIFVGVQTHPQNDPRAALVQRLGDQGFPVLDLTENELAKLHLRHMVGGHAPQLGDEMLLRFEFPERPGALFKFLDKLGGRWNITLFHYRNHGAADGRVLAGLAVPPAERAALVEALEDIGYPWWDESDNPACRLFLG